MVPSGVRSSAGKNDTPTDASMEAITASYSPSLKVIFTVSPPKPVAVLFSSLRFSLTESLLRKIGWMSVLVIRILLESSEYDGAVIFMEHPWRKN